MAQFWFWCLDVISVISSSEESESEAEGMCVWIETQTKWIEQFCYSVHWMSPVWIDQYVSLFEASGAKPAASVNSEGESSEESESEAEGMRVWIELMT